MSTQHSYHVHLDRDALAFEQSMFGDTLVLTIGANRGRVDDRHAPAPIKPKPASIADQSIVLYVHDGTPEQIIESLLDPLLEIIQRARAELLRTAGLREIEPDEPTHDLPFHLGYVESCYACRWSAARKAGAAK